MRYASCHPNREHHAKGLCKPCYDTEYSKIYQRTYRVAHREEMKAYQRSYYAKHREKKVIYWAEHRRERAIYVKGKYNTDPDYRLANVLRSRMVKALKNKQKSGSAVSDLGCSIPHFKLYIENQFEPGMSWDNYGEWHLDHVLPLSSFDLTDRSQFLTACNWLNYQPMWAADNLRKGGHR